MKTISLGYAIIVCLCVLHVAVSESAENSYEEPEIYYTVVCQNRNMQIACFNGKVIEITMANYGRSDQNTCPKRGEMDDVNCRALYSMDIVSERCNGRDKCTVPVNNGIFGGDPCRGTRKYLEVQYECLESQIPVSTTINQTVMQTTTTVEPTKQKPVTTPTQPHRISLPTLPPPLIIETTQQPEETTDSKFKTTKVEVKVTTDRRRLYCPAVKVRDIDWPETLTGSGNVIKQCPSGTTGKWWQLPYFWVGIKAYDIVAGKQCLKKSYFLSKAKALEIFPMLKKDALVGALVYYDGTHNDARMNITIGLTAARLGATIANHTEVLELTKTTTDNGRKVISGAKLKDCLSGQTFEVKAKAVINATGPFTDKIRQMANNEIQPICQPSAGVHIVLPGYYSPETMGLLDPATSDGRIIFFLPWLNKTLAGTTDTPCELSHSPAPSEKDIQFILDEIKNYLSPDVQVRRGDVLAAWSGIRPLVTDPSAKNTQSLSRNHVIEVSPERLITIAGGKWTTYRSMASDTIDAAVRTCNLNQACASQTDGMLLDGAAGWTPTMFIRLVQDYGLDTEVAKHLASTYGHHAFEVAKLAELTGKRWPLVGVKLVDQFPYLEAEVKFAVQEYACTVVDVLARRTRLAFLNIQAAEEALPRVVELMAKELGWSKQKQKEEHDEAIKFLYEQMGSSCRENLMNIPINFSEEDIKKYNKKFDCLDRGKKGYITLLDVRKFLDSIGEKVTEDQLRDMMNEVDCNKNGRIEKDEFLQLMSALKTGAVSISRLGTALALSEMKSAKAIPTDRSGGGL
ncbi:glycerol-3-phosphate dehydrogenase, mitochondrial-like [Saccoglossus kowalevskii]|uniref:glycerol-3-phosphate dehydrogenase n=1 Tax=Saccoglossus kowalevskii TaxID=10224 RepID=A0ABM0MCJ4_SACKO|nr:PREDICTED: glycerol-3-phosphate dehydrogenase, mitochondrial-like [Saccoglossus kowalevskii]